MLCMIGVPSYLTCSELISFVEPGDNISEMKIVRESTPNQYMVILKFKTYVSLLKILHLLYMFLANGYGFLCQI